ncbi:MAG: DNA mismatch repair protein MutS [Nitrospiraceae bacterium]|nr:DNA mismatch repair protein MutS [Nitrospiraceae bacterium]
MSDPFFGQETGTAKDHDSIVQDLNTKESKDKTSNLTPMLHQYKDIKSQYPDAILFFHIGDFYEMFLDDAEIASRILEITLTSRNRHAEKKIPMCGIPVHAAENYLTRLVQSGHRVAICEQVEDPKKAKGLVRREVVRVVTPGLITAEGSIGAKANNFLVSIKPGGNRDPWGLSYLDISTGEFRVTELSGEREVLAELFRLEPAELLLPENQKESPLVAQVRQAIPEAFLSFRPDLWWQNDRGTLGLKRHLKTLSLDGFGLTEFSSGIGTAGALLSYTLETQKEEASHINCLTPYHLSDYLIIDEATKRNLELLANSLDHGRHGTLLEVLDLTVTPMGGRLLKKWVLYPLRDLSKIRNRLSAVEILKRDPSARKALVKVLRQVHDLERLVARTVLGTANARDLLALKESITQIPEIKKRLEGLIEDIPEEAQEGKFLREICSDLDPLQDIAGLIDSSIRDDCSVHLREGRLIKEGFNPELDELIHIQRDGRSFIAGIEAKERERTKIPSLKVGFNKVFGYYLEISKARTFEIPDDYIRKQTLVSAERYITPELKEMESKILTAQETRLTLEYEIFQDIRHQIAAAGPRIQETAAAMARLDCLSSFAEVADRYRYVRPELDQGQEISICQGRHPVLEYALKEGFVPNDIELNHQNSQLLIITGPNMAGKSTVLRQTALIVFMAQMGSFVPAKAAKIGIVDQIFTRVGATDYLTRGQSTFMVEMNETANILHNATSRSLVILDEIGRGTSTYDGLAIAWAVAEHLLHKDKEGVKTLFATHYHELTDLAKRHQKVRNMHMAIKEWEGQIVFLRRLVDGAASRSYGIQVAALAGVPGPVIEKAKEILGKIEKKASNNKKADSVNRTRPKEYLAQMPLPLVIDQGAELRQMLSSVDINNITPIEALNYLSKLKSMAEKSKK